MDEAPRKGGPSLSIDRAAFLILRVKKAFKKKRQQRKDKQAAQQAALSQSNSSRSTKRPAPLLRSRTLPAIVVPGISILQAQIDPTRLNTGDGLQSSGFTSRLSLQSRNPRISLTSDDSSLEYRRKSAGSPYTPTSTWMSGINTGGTTIGTSSGGGDPYIYACDEFERHADGTVVLRIPAPHVVAARAYRMSASTSGPSGAAAMAACSSGSASFSGPSGVSLLPGGSGSNSSGGGREGTALYRLARLLNQTTRPSPSPILKDDAPRRLSWERRDPANSRLPRSSSIDSMVEAVWSESPRPSLTVPQPQDMYTFQYQQQQSQFPVNNSITQPSRRESLLSPGAGRRTKQHRGMTELTLPDLVTKPTSYVYQPSSPCLSDDTDTSSSTTASPNSLRGFDKKRNKFFRNSTNMEFLVPHPPSSIINKTNQQNGGSGGFVLRQNSTGSTFVNQQHQQKMTKKQLKLAQAQLDKLTQINIHLHALFSAVEHGHLEKARTILESTDVDVNSLNSDGLAPLDVAVLSNNRSMTRMLLQHGAIEGCQFKSPDTLGNHLNALLRDAEHRVHDLGGAEDNLQAQYNTRASFSSIIGNAYTSPSVTGCAGSDSDKQLGLWERRVKGLRRMLLGWDQARPPDPPNSVTCDVTGVNAVTVRVQEPNDGPIATKFKIQWSSRADFSNIVGEREVTEWSSQQGVMGSTCRLIELTQGRRYFFRATCGNVKGWGQFRLSTPSSVTPSSWRDVDNREPRFAGRQRALDDLFTAVRLARPDDASDIPLETPALQRRNPKKKTTIKQLFSAASKFQKNLRRGIYLACILYHEDKVLVTNEDFIPVIEIDETYPSCLYTDYHWLMKVACTWDDVKSLRTDMERNATAAVHFRTKLLSAASQMQSALCITDLGQLFHKPLRDTHGTVVLSCVNCVKSPKTVSVLNSRWLPLNKVHKKISALHEDNNIIEILMNSIQEQITYHQASTVKLTKGLYLGYLKLQSSVDLIQAVVPSKTPNVLPHCKIRDNPHVSAEEWEFLKCHKSPSVLDFRPPSDRPTEVQRLFLEALTTSVHRIFKYMDISIEDALTHRLYDVEVIELSPEVSFLIVCPPAELSCAVPGQREILLQRGDLLSLPIQAFEMVHLRTYQNSIIQKYSRLSCILELDTVLANHSHREAFSSSELQAAKERLAKIHELTSNLNAVWKGVRWLMDVISFARDRGCSPGLNMKEILDFQEHQENITRDENANGTKRQLLQPPPRDNKLVKSSPGRGSWPGPAVSNSMSANGLLGAEHSKSEQHLSIAINLGSRYLSAHSGLENSSRKNSADSNYSHSGNSYYSAGESGGDHVAPRLPPSRSEDTLFKIKKPVTTASHRKRATTVNSLSAASSPLLNVRPTYPDTTDSVHSLSSDSESANCPVSTSTPNKPRIKTSTHQLSVSRSMSSVKTSDEYTDALEEASEARNCRKQLFEAEQPATFLRPTLTAIQNEVKTFREQPLHIAEDENHEQGAQPFLATPGLRGSETRSDCRSNIQERGTQPSDRRTYSFQPPTSTSESASSSKEKQQGDEDEASAVNSVACSNQSGIIQVYAAYETGLASGTSLKLHVTPKTSAREVVDLVVKQLNMAVVLKGKDGPIYTSDKLENFCLVAVIGARERCLRDDFKPLQLQNPWQKGRLYVRQKHDVLAAIEHSNRDSHII